MTQNAVTTYFDEANSWELDKAARAEKSERRAWSITYLALILAAILAAGYCFLLPLKTTEPFLVRVDSETGVPDIVTMLKEETIGFNEVMDKYWLAQYIEARETYDWQTLQHDYDRTVLLSCPNVGKEYVAQFEGPDALDRRFGKDVKATVHVVSVVPQKDGTGLVRFTKLVKRVDDLTNTVKPQHFLAVVAYNYSNATRLKESDRLQNPMGFQACSYRPSPEMVESK